MHRNKISHLLIKRILYIYFIVVLFITIIQLATEYSQTQNAIRQELQELEKGFAESITTALWAENAAQIEALANGILNLSIVTGIEITNEDTTLSISKFQTTKSDLFYQFDLNYSFENNSFNLGQATVYSDHFVVFERVKVGFFLLFFSALIKSFILTALFIWAINKFLKKPLLQFTNQMEAIDIENIDKNHLANNTETASELYRLNEVFRRMHFKIGEHIENLTELKELYQNIFTHVQVGIYQMDFDGKLLTVNQAMSKIIGYASEQDLLDKMGNLRDMLTEQDYEAFISQIRNNGKLISEINIVSRNGSPVTCELSAFAIFDRQGEPILIEGMLQDLSEKKAKEKALREKEGAIEASLAKSQFLANMSHELRTPLNSILGFSRIIARSPNLNLEDQENIRIVNRSGEHLLELINNILDLSKIEADKTSLIELDFDLHIFLDTVRDICKIQFDNKGLYLRCEKAPDIPKYVRADETKLKQILVNLLSNAAKFTNEGGAIVRLKTRTEAPNSTSDVALRFEVEDTGPGIPLENLDRIFDPFVQDQTGLEAPGGTGLGLSISRKFAQLMKGDISVKSVVSQGTLFIVDVQAHHPVHTAPSNEASNKIIGVRPNSGVARISPYRILIVDDVPNNRFVLDKLLSPMGFETEEARDGQEAIDVWKKLAAEGRPLHLIWMDMKMPGMDGYEATQEIKQMAEEIDVRTVIIAVSATTSEDTIEKIRLAGCDDFVVKPYKLTEIFEKMHQHLNLSYVYEKPKNENETEVLSDEEILKQIHHLPSNWKHSMKKAIEHVDMDLIGSLLNQIYEQHTDLAGVIQQAIDQYEYQKVLIILENE